MTPPPPPRRRSSTTRPAHDGTGTAPTLTTGPTSGGSETSVTRPARGAAQTTVTRPSPDGTQTADHRNRVAAPHPAAGARHAGGDPTIPAKEKTR
ncbi:hypothetical protein [Streptomyces sp. NPDC047028]|uniref:hypothetical protein n=1 Tax=Streptomyces sp. NPDC047028 TaxID=3155793 RepID=UPI0033F15FA8